MSSSKRKVETQVVHLGRDTAASRGFVNLPVYHGSTVLYDSLDAMKLHQQKKTEPGAVTYGRFGTPASFALEESIAEIEGAHAAITTSSGLSAITSALLAFLERGDHLLVVDSVYQPTRNFCDGMLSRFGVSTTYYHPLAGAEISASIQENTKLIYLESPGSNTFEIQDIPVIAAVARQRGIVTVIDNTWATPVYLKPFELGLDVSVHAGTKYITGHADAMLGIVTATEECYPKVKAAVQSLGDCAGPDVIFLALRGLRTLPTRLSQHQRSGLTVARWLQDQPEVARVIHPALPDDPGNRIWRRDFSGACGLFAFVVADASDAKVTAFVDALELFGQGYSWGGFESLLIPASPVRTCPSDIVDCDGQLMRIHVGLEDADDLIADLTCAFEAMRAAAD